MAKNTLLKAFLAALVYAAPAPLAAQWTAPVPGSPAARLAEYLNKTGAGSAAILPKDVPRQVVVYAYGGTDKNIEFQSRANAVIAATPEVLHLKVSFGPDFTARLKGIQKTGAKISKLVIDSHGSAGSSQVFGSGDLAAMKGLDSAFAAPADIYFHACNIAVGKAGEKFLQDIGTTLLAKGGSVTGTVGEYNDFGPLRYGMPEVEGMTLKGYLRYKVYPGGKGDFSYIPVGVQEVGERADARIRQAEALARAKTKTDRMIAGFAVDTIKLFGDASVDATKTVGGGALSGGGFLMNANLEGHRRLAKAVAPGGAAPVIDYTVNTAQVQLRDQSRKMRKKLDEGAVVVKVGSEIIRQDIQRGLTRAERIQQDVIQIGGTAVRTVWETQYYGPLESFSRAKDGATWLAGKASAWWNKK